MHGKSCLVTDTKATSVTIISHLKKLQLLIMTSWKEVTHLGYRNSSWLVGTLRVSSSCHLSYFHSFIQCISPSLLILSRSPSFLHASQTLSSSLLSQPSSLPSFNLTFHSHHSFTHPPSPHTHFNSPHTLFISTIILSSFTKSSVIFQFTFPCLTAIHLPCYINP